MGGKLDRSLLMGEITGSLGDLPPQVALINTSARSGGMKSYFASLVRLPRSQATSTHGESSTAAAGNAARPVGYVPSLSATSKETHRAPPAESPMKTILHGSTPSDKM
eukprot:CAMPEP_0204334906 /NCGR_PEP_ID=MMETSP0469-20131031/18354_1 /ASSEMBLY_ACC=CAM_ASM_000384 /TAXON_ID=2969 /ORGANISM="Oxyrrhis marina" /LENGTH=107 /DNA_ID=CAMNT_0051318471 /DNA_START=182 /DNA_END=505 /DNA_ORIENTATION=+